MASASVQIAQAVVTHITANAMYSQPFTAERSYVDWELELEDQGVLHVDVVANSVESKAELSSRTTVKQTVPVDIAIRKRFGAADQDANGRINIQAIDDMMSLVDEIYEVFMPQRLTGFTEAVWKETKLLACPIHEALKKQRQFTAIIQVTFQRDKKIT